MIVLDFLRGFTIPLRQVFRPKLTDFYPKEKSPKPRRAASTSAGPIENRCSTIAAPTAASSDAPKKAVAP